MHTNFNRRCIVDLFSLPDGPLWAFSKGGEAQDVSNGAGYPHLVCIRIFGMEKFLHKNEDKTREFDFLVILPISLVRVFLYSIYTIVYPLLGMASDTSHCTGPLTVLVQPNAAKNPG
jgi:hypothetical protein